MNVLRNPFRIRVGLILAFAAFAAAKDVPTDGSTNVTAFTVCSWVRPDVWPLDYMDPGNLVVRGNGWNRGFCLCMKAVDGAYYPCLLIGGKPGGRLKLQAEKALMPPGRWSHVACSWDGRTASLFLNGERVASSAFGGPYVAVDEPLIVGRARNGITYFPFVRRGLKDIWTRAFSAEEIRRDAAAKPDEPDSVRLVELIEKHRMGQAVSRRELEEASRGRELVPETRETLLEALVSAAAGEKDFAAAREALARLKVAVSGSARAARHFDDFRVRYARMLARAGYAEESLAELKALWEEARERKRPETGEKGAYEEPYAALALWYAYRRSGRESEAADLRCRNLGENLRLFPQIASELGAPLEAGGAAAAGGGSKRPNGLQVFVSPTGDDQAAGTRAKPFRTLSRARDAIRTLKKGGQLPAGGVTVFLRGGVYPVTETFALSAEDSGTGQAPVTYRAWKGERPVLDGGWTVPVLAGVTDPAALARIPPGARSHVRCCDVRAVGFTALEPQERYGYSSNKAGKPEINAPPPILDLYADGELLQLARHPNDGFLFIGEVLAPGVYAVDVGDFTPWMREPELMMFGYWAWFWADLTARVDKIEPERKAFKIDRCLDGKKGHTVYLVNALCALDRPGEWFLDRASGVLYVWPPAREGVFSGLFRKPAYTLSRFEKPFVSLEGVRDVRFEGLVFQCGRGSGLAATNCEDIVFSGNVVRNFGNDGLRALDCRNFMIEDCVMHTLGYGGVRMTGGDRRNLVPSGNVLRNCEISRVERRRRVLAPCIQIEGMGGEVSFNRFRDVPASAMRCEGNEFLVVSNVIETCVTECDDNGACDVYDNQSYAGCRFCFNVWRDLRGGWREYFRAGQAAIRFDGNISSMTVYGNRFVGCGAGHFGAVQINGGRMNTVDNNLFVECPLAVSITEYPLKYWQGEWDWNDGKYKKGMLTKQVDVRSRAWRERYPWLAGLRDTEQHNFLVRNVVVGTGWFGRELPPHTVFSGNFHFPEMPDLAKLTRETAFRPLPDESELGPRPTAAFRRAQANDR